MASPLFPVAFVNGRMAEVSDLSDGAGDVSLVLEVSLEIRKEEIW